MAQQTSISPAQPITIGGEKYRVRTVTVWNDKGTSGTIDDKVKPIIKTQYQEEGVLSQWKDLADRTDNKSINNGWSFRPIAGQGFKKALVESGPNSLTSQLDNAAVNQVAKDAKVSTTRVKQVLSTTALTQQNKALAAANQDPNAVAGGQNTSQAAANTGASDGTAPVDLKIEGTGKKEGFGNHRYPLDLDKSKQDKIKFNMLRYAPRGFQSFSRGGENLGALTNRESTNKRILGSVILPVPSGISETNSCGWGEQPATPFELLAQNIALTSIQKGFGSGADVLGGAVSAAASPENSQELKTAVTGLIAQNAAGAGGLLSRTQGAVINPNLELLFNGPALRPFSFTFKMSARSETEAKEIIKIIRFFKQGMSPQKSKSNLFIKAPHTFEIRYILGSSKDKNHPFIGQIKECALQSFNVNYTPEGQYATFYDGPMISYEIQMQFTELEPVFNEDYGTGGSDLPVNLLFSE